MSARLIGELAQWLLSPAAEGMTPVERCILFVVAERSNTDTRIMWRFKGDEMSLYDRVLIASGVGPSGLKKAFQRLADRGLEVRIPIKEGKDGRPVYSCEGHSMKFRFPVLPASFDLPERGPSGAPSEGGDPVENPVDDSPAEGSGGDERGPSGAASEGRGDPTGPPLSQEGTPEGPPNPYREHPYRAHPYEETPPPASSGAEVEDVPAAPDEPSAKKDQGDEFGAARAVLNAQPDFGQQAMDAAAKELPGAGMRALVIRAAQLASKGIPA